MDQPESKKLARVYSRLAAYLIDILIITLLSIPVAIIAGLIIILIGAGTAASLTALNSTALALPAIIIMGFAVIIITWLIPASYFAYFQSRNGQTPGLKFIGIKLTSEDGSLLTFGRAFVRAFVGVTLISIINTGIGMIPYAGSFLSLVIGALWVGWCIFDKKAQNLYDKMFKTIYVSENEETGKAKWTIGCCGCPLFLIIIASLIAAIIGLGSYAVQNIPDTSEPQVTTTTINPSAVRDSEFYKACISSAPQGVDLSAYCECTSTEFDKGQTDINAVVNICKSYLQE
jgi:uncharacterized RDD family membrane protein YckC